MRVATFAAPAIVGLVVFFRWFSTGYFYAEGDIDPFVRNGLRSEFGGQWTHQASGAGGPTYEVVRAVELVYIELARLVGGTEALAQRLFFASIFAFASFGVALFVATFNRRAWLVFAAGVCGACNPFVMQGLANPLPPLTIGLVGTIGAIVVRAAAGGRRRWFGLVLLTFPLSYLVINPPLFAVVVAWAFVVCLAAPFVQRTGRAGYARVAELCARAAVPAVLVSLWWMVPTWFTLTRASDAGTMLAETDVRAWAWTQRNSSLGATAALMGRWSWPDPRYHAATWLADPPWSWTIWILPIGVLLAPICARRQLRRAALSLLAACALLVFVGKGLHEPLGDVNLWLYRNVPGFFLLREPVSKVGVILVPLELTAWVLTTDGVLARLAGVGAKRWAGVVATCVLMLGPAIAAWPMLTGEAVKDRERVKIPDDWYAVASFLEHGIDDGGDGKVLVLPLADYYQLPTTWGYYGTDHLVRQLSTRPVITLDPEAYIGDSPTFSALVRAVEEAIVSGDAASAPKLLDALGVSDIVVRKDIDHSSTIRVPNVARAEVIEAGLAQIAGLERRFTTDVADVWHRVTDGAAPVQALGGLLVTGDTADEQLGSLLMAMPDGLALVDNATGDVSTRLVRGTAHTVVDDEASLPPNTTWDVARRATAAPLFQASIETVAGQSSVVLRDAPAWSIDGATLPRRPEIRVPAGTEHVFALDINGREYDLSEGPTLVRLDASNRITPLALQGGRLGSFGELGDCNRYDERTPEQVGLALDMAGDGDGRVVTLHAADHAACVRAPVMAQPGDSLLIEMEARSASGAAPRACLWLDGPNVCAALPGFQPGDNGWASLRARYTVPAEVQALWLYLYADRPTSGDATTVTHYRFPRVGSVVRGETAIRDVQQAPSMPVTVGASGGTVQAAPAEPPVELGSPSPVGDCHRTEPITLEQAGIAATHDGDVMQLTADRHSACVHIPVLGLVAAGRYELSFDCRILEGSSPPRVCLVGTRGRCTSLGSFERSPTWTSVSVDVEPPVDAVGDAKLYLYADAGREASTIEYRQISLRPVVGESLTFVTAGTTAGGTPSIGWEQDGPARYRVDVRDADGPFVLALTESWSPDWRVSGLPEDARIEQVRIDGYRNAWAIDARGSFELVIEYAPARWGRLAMSISLITAALLASWVLVAVVRHVWLRRKHHYLAPIFGPPRSFGA
ncbi:MAG TPA: hypothetical protein VF183_16715 [Acidimicrobiales bacterium]